MPIRGDRQGGLLDIISEDNNIWLTGSIQKDGGYTTAVFKAKLKNNKLVDSQLIFEALPYISNQIHFGSRMALKGEHLYVSIGERGKGMIAQDPSNAIGSIIRINKDGTIPDDNPFVDQTDWPISLIYKRIVIRYSSVFINSYYTANCIGGVLSNHAFSSLTNTNI